MNDRYISRRYFAMLGLLSGTGFLARGGPLSMKDARLFAPQGAALTARQVIERIQKDLAEHGVAWRTQTVDTFKVGNSA
ncbi:MAG TPA: hypothetical protein VFY40_19565 [Blastocatellia bacterium]|nr:hypothetical protein [Blastocatellia bacterium]